MLDNTILVSFAGTDIHKEYQKRLNNYCRDRFALVTAWNLENLSHTDFYKNNQHIFKYKKYSGYFLWKPYIIKKTLETFPGSNVLYVDSNLYFRDWDNFEEVFNYYMDKQGLFFVQHWNRPNIEWTKFDCFWIMGTDDSILYKNQIWSVIQGWSHNNTSLSLLNDYLEYCTDENCVTDLPNKWGSNYPEFREHRWEQSILSILVDDYDIEFASDAEVIRYVDKDYSQELLKQKEEENRNSLGEV